MLQPRSFGLIFRQGLIFQGIQQDSKSRKPISEHPEPRSLGPAPSTGFRGSVCCDRRFCSLFISVQYGLGLLVCRYQCRKLLLASSISSSIYIRQHHPLTIAVKSSDASRIVSALGGTKSRYPRLLLNLLWRLS